jgi:anthranilate phosphoribosyltransferase
MTMQAAISRVMERGDLAPAEAAAVMACIAGGHANDAQIGCLLGALRTKGETAGEIAAFARVMQDAAVPIHLDVSGPVVDTCGTGGDCQGTFNISTAAAIVAASAGATVVKHGNRGVSSRCGSADVLSALGVKIDLPPGDSLRMVRETGFGFLFAPLYHPAMGRVAPVRREIGARTVFNILGPLLSPVNADARLVGVYDPALVPVMAGALSNLGVRTAMVVHGSGLDEITVTGPTTIAYLDGETVSVTTVTPEEFGIARAPPASLAGGTPDENAALVRSVLGGAPGPCQDIVVLNAGAALVLGGLSPDIATGMTLARESITSGAAARKLDQIVQVSEGAA